MADQEQHDHPQIPGLTSMAWFAAFLGIALLVLTLTLQFKFGTPG